MNKLKKNIKQKWKESKLKHYLIFPSYFILLFLVNLLNVNFIWLHTIWMITTIITGLYIIMYGEDFIPNFLKPKLGKVNINKNEIDLDIPVISRNIINKFEVK